MVKGWNDSRLTDRQPTLGLLKYNKKNNLSLIKRVQLEDRSGLEILTPSSHFIYSSAERIGGSRANNRRQPPPTDPLDAGDADRWLEYEKKKKREIGGKQSLGGLGPERPYSFLCFSFSSIGLVDFFFFSFRWKWGQWVLVPSSNELFFFR